LCIDHCSQFENETEPDECGKRNVICIRILIFANAWTQIFYSRIMKKPQAPVVGDPYVAPRKHRVRGAVGRSVGRVRRVRIYTACLVRRRRRNGERSRQRIYWFCHGSSRRGRAARVRKGHHRSRCANLSHPPPPPPPLFPRSRAAELGPSLSRPPLSTNYIRTRVYLTRSFSKWALGAFGGGGAAGGPEKILHVSLNSEIGHGAFKQQITIAIVVAKVAQHMVSLNICLGGRNKFEDLWF